MAPILSQSEMIALRAAWKREGRRVVFTNGCFDLLHPGHVRLLESARSLADKLILALNTDDSVRRHKGPARPLVAQARRGRLAASLEAVDAVVFFEEETPRELIAALQPDYLVKGSDWTHFIAGREEVEAAGGSVLALPLEPGFSSTSMEAELLRRTP